MPLCGQLWGNLPQLLVLYMASRCWASGWEGGAGNVTGEGVCGILLPLLVIFQVSA